MKIVASKRDELIKARDRYDADYRDKLNKRDAELGDYYHATDAVTSRIARMIEDQLDNFPALEFDVDVRPASYDSKGVRVRIECNEHARYRQDSALSWSYTAEVVKNGEIKKETNSWSGLKAVTDKQLESLVQSVEALKVINRFDWEYLLNVELPHADQFVKTKLPNAADRPDFETQILIGDIREIIGQPKFVQDRSQKYAYAFTGETDKLFRAYRTSADIFYYTNHTPEEIYEMCERMNGEVRVKKSDLVETFGKELTIIE